MVQNKISALLESTNQSHFWLHYAEESGLSLNSFKTSQILGAAVAQ